MGRFDFRTRTGLVYNIIQSGGFDSDALSFFNRVTVAGGILSTLEQTAINQLVVDLKTYGLWDSMKAIYPMVGASAAACSQNLKSSIFTGTFNGGWTYNSMGVTGNAANNYFNTNLQVNTNLSETSNTLSIYSRTNLVGTICDIGARNFGYTNPLGILSNYSNLTYSVWNDYLATIAGVNTAAFFIQTKNSSTLNLFRNNSNIITATKTLAALPTSNIIIGAWQSAVEYEAFSNRQYAFASVGDGLTDTQALDFYTAVQAFQTTLSRQV